MWRHYPDRNSYYFLLLSVPLFLIFNYTSICHQKTKSNGISHCCPLLYGVLIIGQKTVRAQTAGWPIPELPPDGRNKTATLLLTERKRSQKTPRPGGVRVQKLLPVIALNLSSRPVFLSSLPAPPGRLIERHPYLGRGHLIFWWYCSDKYSQKRMWQTNLSQSVWKTSFQNRSSLT